MISLNLDNETEHTISVKEILTFVEFLEREEVAREKCSITNPLNTSELLLIYVCYFVDKVFPNEDAYDVENLTPTDIAIINNVYTKMAQNDPTYEDRVKWITDMVKLVYAVYIEFLTTEDLETAFKDNFGVMDDVLYRMITETVNTKTQPWDYLAIYDKQMISCMFIKYVNGYLDSLNEIYDDDNMDTADVNPDDYI